MGGGALVVRPACPVADETSMATLVEERTGTDYFAIPVLGLSGRGTVPFPLYLGTGTRKWVLYQPADQEFADRHEVRLRMKGVDTLFIQAEDRPRYARRVEENLDLILKDRTLGIEKRAEILHQVALEVGDDLFAASPDQATMRRARRFMASTARLVVRDNRAFTAIRRVLGAGEELAVHSMTVGLLSIGLAREVLGQDTNMLLNAGLAGLVHDIGHLDAPGGEYDRNDPEHPEGGYRFLKEHGLPQEICEAALYHHERFDGSGYPKGLNGEAIPVLARIVGLVNTFHRVYSEQGDEGPAGTFESLRILARIYRGCFDARLAGSFVQLFAY